MCLNGGFCDGHTSVKTCLCPLGFSGENCRTGDYINVSFTFTKEMSCAIAISILYFEQPSILDVFHVH